MKKFFFLILTIFVFLFFIPIPVNAALCTWQGLSTDWHDGSNWGGCGGNPPIPGDVVLFPTTATNKIVDIGSTNVNVEKLTFEDTYTINGTASIILNNTNNSIVLQTNSGKTVTINAKVTFQHSTGGKIEVQGTLASGYIKLNNELSYTSLEVTTGTAFAFTRRIEIYGTLKKIGSGSGNIITPSGDNVNLFLQQADPANNGLIDISGFVYLRAFSSSMNLQPQSGTNIQTTNGGQSEINNYSATASHSLSLGDGADVASENLNIKGNINITGGGTFNYFPNSSSQLAKLVIKNTATITNFSSVNFSVHTSNGFIPSNSGQALTLIDYQKSGAFPSSFSGYSEGSTFNIGSVLYRITYQGGDGNDVVICPDNSSLYTSTCSSISSTPTPTPTITLTPTPVLTPGTNQSSSLSISGGSHSVNTPKCNSEKPSHAPELFQIHTFKDKAVLYFTPVNTHSDRYFISYGFKPGEERFGVEFNQGHYDGVLSYIINFLSPNTTYYFKIRAGNNCMPGDWSNQMKATTQKISLRKPSIFHFFVK